VKQDHFINCAKVFLPVSLVLICILCFKISIWWIHVRYYYRIVVRVRIVLWVVCTPGWMCNVKVKD